MLPSDSFEQLRRQTEQSQRILDSIDTSGVQRAIEQQRRQFEQVQQALNWIDSASLQPIAQERRLSQAFKPIADDLARVQRAMETIIDSTALSQISTALARYEVAPEPLLSPETVANVGRILEGLAQQIPAVSEIPQLSAAISEAMGPLNEQLSSLQLAGPAVREALLELEATETAEDRQQVLTRLLSAIEDWLRRQKPSGYTAAIAMGIARNLPSLVLTLLIATWQNEADDAREALQDARYRQSVKRDNEVAAQVARITKTIEAFVSATPRLLLEVHASVPLRPEPNAKSTKVTNVEAGSLVELLHRDKRWLQVLYVDAVTGEAVVGWIYQRHVTFLAPKEHAAPAPSASVNETE